MGASLLGNIETAKYVHKLIFFFFMYSFIFERREVVYENLDILQ